MHTPLAQKTIRRVTSAIEQNGESAGMAEIAELIQQLSSKALHTSVQELADLIGKDIVVSAKVITAANTLGFNPAGHTITTLPQAIQLIGFNKVRQLALSLLLIENAERSLNPVERREIASIALCSGMIAEAAMNRNGSFLPEQAFICASLRCYGRLLMTTFMLDEYRQALVAINEGADEDDTFNLIFGLTPLELGHHLLACAHLPDLILQSLKKFPLESLRRATEQPDLQLLALSDLAVKLADYALKPSVSRVHFDQQLQRLATRHGRLFGFAPDDLLGLLSDAGEQIQIFNQIFGLKGISSQLLPRLQSRVAGIEPPGAAFNGTAPPTRNATTPPVVPASVSSHAASGSAPPLTESPAPAAPARSRETVFQDAFTRAIQEITSLLGEPTIPMKRVYALLLDAARTGLASQDSLILVRSGSGKPYHCDYGCGPAFEAQRGTGLAREGERNVLGLCLTRLEDIYINDATAPSIVPHLPDWLRATKFNSMVIFPMHESRAPFAIMIVGWPEKKAVKFTDAELRQIRALLRLVGTAHRLSLS